MEAEGLAIRRTCFQPGLDMDAVVAAVVARLSLPPQAQPVPEAAALSVSRSASQAGECKTKTTVSVPVPWLDAMA